MKKIFLLLLIFIIAVFLIMGCNSVKIISISADNPIRIISAERTHIVTTFAKQQYTPLNLEEDVLLI